MNKYFSSSARLPLVAITTLISIAASLCIFYILYGWLGIEVRKSEIMVGILAPLLIASACSWYLVGLIKKLELLETELRNSITKEKEEIYLATIHGAQHITNNLLNGLILIGMEIDKHSDFDPERRRQYFDLIESSKNLIQQLSSVDDINADKIRKSVAP